MPEAGGPNREFRLVHYTNEVLALPIGLWLFAFVTDLAHSGKTCFSGLDCSSAVVHFPREPPSSSSLLITSLYLGLRLFDLGHYTRELTVFFSFKIVHTLAIRFARVSLRICSCQAECWHEGLPYGRIFRCQSKCKTF
jgi:hypothetical protein